MTAQMLYNVIAGVLICFLAFFVGCLALFVFLYVPQASKIATNHEIRLQQLERKSP